MGQDLTISAVICTHASERLEDLAAGLAGLAAQTRPPAEVVVVVDRNPELRATVEARWPWVRVVANTDHGGIAGARNTALGAAVGDVVAFLDDDAVPAPDWLERLTAPYADPDVQVVGGWVTPAWDLGRPAHLPPELDWVVGCSHRGRPTLCGDVRNVTGASISLRRGLVAEVGGFDERVSRKDDVPMSCDDTEFCIRVAQRRPGSRIVMEPGAVVHHRVTAHRGTWTYLRARSYAEGLSKATVASLVGVGEATSDERDYVRRVLPRAFARELVRGRLRAAAGVVIALAWTGWGYLAGRRTAASATGGAPRGAPTSPPRR
jgi:GT2 family glycosyltransferase